MTLFVRGRTRGRAHSRPTQSSSAVKRKQLLSKIMFLEKLSGRCACGNVHISGRKVYSFACHCDACRRTHANRGDGFATAILGLKMFAKVSCDEKESIEEQKCITRSTIVPCAGVNRLTCALCDTYVGGRGFGVYSGIEFMNLRLCENAKEEEVVADFYLTDEKRKELQNRGVKLPSRPHFSNDWLCTAMFFLYFFKSVFFDGVYDVLSVGFGENIREEAPCVLL